MRTSTYDQDGRLRTTFVYSDQRSDCTADNPSYKTGLCYTAIHYNTPPRLSRWQRLRRWIHRAILLSDTPKWPKPSRDEYWP